MGKRVFKIAGLCLQLNLITLIVVLHHITNMAFYQRIARLEAGSGGHLRARAEFGLGPWWPYQDGWDDTCSSVQLITDLVYLGISSNIIHEHWGSIPSSDHPMFNRQSHQGINISPSFFQRRFSAEQGGCRWVQMPRRSSSDIWVWNRGSQGASSDFAIRPRKSSVNISQGFFDFYCFWPWSPAVVVSIWSSRRVDQARTNKPKATTWSATGDTMGVHGRSHEQLWTIGETGHKGELIRHRRLISKNVIFWVIPHYDWFCLNLHLAETVL
jgi:hypothetical protein